MLLTLPQFLASKSKRRNLRQYLQPLIRFVTRDSFCVFENLNFTPKHTFTNSVYSLVIHHSPVHSTAGHKPTRAHRPNPLPPRLPHLRPLLMRTKTWSSPAPRCPPKIPKQWTPVSHSSQKPAKSFYICDCMCRFFMNISFYCR